MKRAVLTLALRAVQGGILAALALLLPVDWTEVLDGYLIFLGALLLYELVRAAHFPSAARKPKPAARRRPARPPELARLEDQVAIAAVNAADLHYRMRPVLREAAGELLLARRGVDLDGPAARAILGDEAWELLRPDRQPPADRFARGLPPRRLAAVVDEIEAAL